MILLRPKCLCSHSLTLFVIPFAHGKISATTGGLYGLGVIFESSVVLVRLNRVCNVPYPNLGHLGAQPSIPSPHYKARSRQATMKGDHNMVRAEKEAAETLITTIRAVHLVVGLKAVVWCPRVVEILHTVGSSILLED